MGLRPIPPLYYKNGIVREERLCGGHNMCEHVLTDKLIAGFACIFSRLHRPINRVQR